MLVVTYLKIEGVLNEKVIRYSLVSTLLVSSFLVGCAKKKTATKPKDEKKVLQLLETGEIPSLNSGK